MGCELKPHALTPSQTRRRVQLRQGPRAFCPRADTSGRSSCREEIRTEDIKSGKHVKDRVFKATGDSTLNFLVLILRRGWGWQWNASWPDVGDCTAFAQTEAGASNEAPARGQRLDAESLAASVLQTLGTVPYTAIAVSPMAPSHFL